MHRLDQCILIISTLIGSWLGMQGVHELGHVLGACLTGGQVEKVVLHPLTISRTDLSHNPQPLIVVWSGPIFGVVFPLFIWLLSRKRLSFAFVLQFFAGFCFIANGLYIGVGSFDQIGDCGEMLRHGAQLWQLWTFGIITAPVGLWLWHGLGPHFGLRSKITTLDRRIVYGTFFGCTLLIILALIVNGK